MVLEPGGLLGFAHDRSHLRPQSANRLWSESPVSMTAPKVDEIERGAEELHLLFAVRFLREYQQNKRDRCPRHDQQ